MSLEMSILINLTPFHLNIVPTIATLAYPIKYNPEGVIVPYMHEEKSTIDTKFVMVKNYSETWKNIYWGVVHAYVDQKLLTSNKIKSFNQWPKHRVWTVFWQIQIQ